MDVDELSLLFVVEYYEYLSTDRSRIDGAYADGASLHLYLKENPPRVYRSSFHTAIPRGVRTVLSCCGSLIADRVHVHVKSTIAQPSIAHVDECFTCAVSGGSLLIEHHSIHVNPIASPVRRLPPPPPPARAPPPPPPPPPVELDDPSQLRREQTVLVKNLSFSCAPSAYLRVLSSRARVTHYVQGRGKLLAQLSDSASAASLARESPDAWCGRVPRVIRMPRDLVWE